MFILSFQIVMYNYQQTATYSLVSNMLLYVLYKKRVDFKNDLSNRLNGFDKTLLIASYFNRYSRSCSISIIPPLF